MTRRGMPARGARLAAWLALALAAAPLARAQDDPDAAARTLAGRARAAIQQGRPREIDRLVESDRFTAYEAADRLVSADDPAGWPAGEAIAEAYARRFGDRSLLERAAVARGWTEAQRSARREATALKQSARAALMAGRTEEALDGYRRALEIFRSLQDWREEGRCHSNLGAVAAMRGESRAALDHLDRALPAIRRAGDRNMFGVAELNWAYALVDLGRTAEALEALDRALPIARETRDAPAEGRILVSRAACILGLGRREEAAAAYREAAMAGRRTGDDELEGTAYLNLAGLEGKAGRPASQRQYLLRALAAARRGGLPALEVDVLFALVRHARARGDAAELRARLDESRRILAGMEDPLKSSMLESLEAIARFERGQYREGLAHLDDAERRIAGLDAYAARSLIQADRASAFYYMGDYDQSLDAYQVSIDLARTAGEPGLEAVNRANLGYLLWVLGDPAGALREISEAARIHGEMGDQVSRAGALNALGSLRWRSGDPDGGRAALEEALLLLPAEGRPGERAEAMKDLAIIEMAGGPDRRRRGLTLLREARGIFTRVGDAVGIAHANLLEAEAALDDGDPAGARAALDRLRRDQLGGVSREHLWLAHHMEGRVLEREGREGAAIDAFRRAVDEVEHLREAAPRAAWRAAILDDRVAPYRALVRLLRDTGRIEEAFRFARAAKARSFVDSLRPPGILRMRADPDRDLQPASRGAGPPAAAGGLSSTRLRSLLGQREALLDFHLDGDELTVFVLRPGSFTARLIRVEPSLAGQAALARWPGRPAAADGPVTEAWRGAVRRLGSAIFGPLSKEIDGADSLLIVPGGALHGVPFGALDVAGRRLIDQRDVAILPASEALVSRTRRGGRGPALAMGNPAAPGAGPGLPAAEQEARFVAARSGGGPALLGEAASEAAFRRLAPAASLLHLAAHSRLDRVAPARSHLLLAPGEGEDGRLEADEIASMRLTASLVVLSGCATGFESGLARRDAPSDDLAGLPRSFLGAGAGRVVAGLWELDDAAALAMMPALYATMEEAGPAAALAALQREAAAGKIRDGAGRLLDHPYYWAGLTVYGAGLDEPSRSRVPPASAAAR